MELCYDVTHEGPARSEGATKKALLLFANKPLQLVCFVFPIKVPGELNQLSFYKLCVDMHVNKTKFERNSSLEYYHMICIGKTKNTR